MAGDALMIGGEAIARDGEALMDSSPVATCCCPGGGCVPQPDLHPCDPPCRGSGPCINGPTYPINLVTWANFVPTVVYDVPSICCVQPTGWRGSARYIANTYIRFNGRWCNAATWVFRYTWNQTGATGTVRRIVRNYFGNCEVTQDQTTPFNPGLVNWTPCGGYYDPFVGPSVLTTLNLGYPTESGSIRQDCDNFYVSILNRADATLYTTIAGSAHVYTDPCPAGSSPTGACCCNGECFSVTASQCAAMGGSYLGNDTSCENTICGPQGPATGSCCRSDGSCFDTDFNTCTQQGGTFRVGVPCAGNPCPPPEVWSCCLPSQAGCVMTTEADCLAQLGNWRRGVDCGQPCPADPVGACCYGNGQCQENTAQQCAGIGGNWLGANTVCAATNCGVGACCSQGAHGGQWVCTQETEAFCATLNNSTFYGAGTVCGNVPCPPIGFRGNVFTGSEFAGSRGFL